MRHPGWASCFLSLVVGGSVQYLLVNNLIYWSEFPELLLHLVQMGFTLEPGFVKATSQNLPQLDMMAVVRFFGSSDEFVSAEFRSKKVQR